MTVRFQEDIFLRAYKHSLENSSSIYSYLGLHLFEREENNNGRRDCAPVTDNTVI